MSKKECYQCGALADKLSARSRCVDCEYNRAEFNARENESLRHSLCQSSKRIRQYQIDGIRRFAKYANNRLGQIPSLAEDFIHLDLGGENVDTNES